MTRLHRVEDFARYRDNALIADRTAAAVRSALVELLALSSDERRTMGERAQQAVSGFTTVRFAAGWRSFYRQITLQAESKVVVA